MEIFTATAYKLHKLGDVLHPVSRPESPWPGTIYRQIGVKLWGEGAYERESIDGSQTKYKTLFKVLENDIIVNKIWARNGSVSSSAKIVTAFKRKRAILIES